jgi:tetratricopeptide (TPR) repeat protein
MRYKDTDQPLSEIAEELDVDAVVEGSVLRSGDRVRITTQLVQAAPERHLWAESYERDLSDILALQGEVARAVAHEIQVTLTPQEEALLSSGRPINPEAHEAYLKGRYYISRMKEIDKALDYFQLAIELDPGYAPAHAGLSYYHTLLAYTGFTTPIEAMPKAKEAALEAIELDDTLSEAHQKLGFVYMSLDWDWRAARREFVRAIALNPGNAEAHGDYGVYLTLVGQVAEGMEEIERARKLDPLEPHYIYLAARSSFFLRHYDQALKQLETTLELEPEYVLAYWYLFRTYWQKGSYDQAWAALLKSGALGPLERSDVELGDKEGILAVAESLDERSSTRYVPKAPMALFYMLAGEKEKALQSLERASEERDPNLVYLKVFPEWDSLRDEPRFQDLVRRINFPEP